MLGGQPVADDLFRAAILAGGRDFGLELASEQVDRFVTHFELLVSWNRKLNLTRIVDPTEAAKFHFLESAMLSTVLENPSTSSRRVVDIGSGAGFPGLPLACVWSDCEFLLIEPSGKRAVFLKEAIRRLGLLNVTVANARYSAANVRDSDVLVARALDGFEQLLESIVTSVAPVIALFTDPTMLALASKLAPNRELRIVEIPGSKNRRIGILEGSGST